jgi:hypothetical protein
MSPIDNTFRLDTAVVLRRQVYFDVLDYSSLRKMIEEWEPELTENWELGNHVPLYIERERLFPPELIESYGSPDKTPTQVEIELLDIAFEHINLPTELEYRLILMDVYSLKDIYRKEKTGRIIVEYELHIAETFKDYELIAYYPEFREWVIGNPPIGDLELSEDHTKIVVVQRG